MLEGEKAEFVCSVSKEAITVQWLRGDTVLEPGDKYDIISDGKKRALVIKETVLGDMGMYTVMVGEAKATAHLAVIGKLLFYQCVCACFFPFFILYDVLFFLFSQFQKNSRL